MTEQGLPPEAVADGEVRVPWAAVATFSVLVCALAWLVCIPLWIDGGLANPFAGLLISVMMFTPGMAAVTVMVIFRTPPRGRRLRALGMWPLRPARRVAWLMVAGWLAPPVIVAASILVAVLIGAIRWDPAGSAFAVQIGELVPADVPLPPIEVLVLLQLVSIPIGALINSVFAFGEELGWRGWLLPALRPLGTWPALVLSGVLWGLWHSPVILLGYNFDRTNVTGVLFMVAGCVLWGVLLGWLRLRSGSLWPAVLAHGALNAAGGMVLLVAAGSPDLAISGPLGVAAWIVGGVVIAVLLATRQFRIQPALAPPRPGVQSVS